MDRWMVTLWDALVDFHTHNPITSWTVIVVVFLLFCLFRPATYTQPVEPRREGRRFLGVRWFS